MATKRPAHRPPKWSDQRAAVIVTAVRAGATLKHAAWVGGICYDTLRVWRQERPEFSAAIEGAEGALQVELLGSVLTGAMGLRDDAGELLRDPDGRVIRAPDSDLALRFCAAKWPEHFGRRRIELTGEDGGPIEQVDSTSSRELLARRIDELAARREARAVREADTG